MPGRSLTWLALAAVALFVLVAGGSTVLAKVRSLPEKVTVDDGRAQSASQISSAEFAAVELGTASAAVRSLMGEPEAKSEHEIEGLRVECWYYGAGSKTGAYQLCFDDGRLHSKVEYS